MNLNDIMISAAKRTLSGMSSEDKKKLFVNHVMPELVEQLEPAPTEDEVKLIEGLVADMLVVGMNWKDAFLAFAEKLRETK